MKKRLIYLDVIKIISILFVIFNHSYWYIQSNSLLSGLIYCGLFGICKIAVPLFLMATGALILSKESNYKEIFFKRIFRICIPIFVINMISIIINHGNLKSFLQIMFFENDISYSPYWLWYLYLLIGIYIMVPYIYKMLKNFKEKDYKIFILIFVFINGFLTMLKPIAKMIFSESFEINNSIIVSVFPISIGYLISGYYLNKIKITKKMYHQNLFIFLITIIIEIIYLFIGNKHFSLTFDELLKYSSLLTAILSLSFFVICKYIISNFKKNLILENIISTLSNCVFGIYLLHPFLIKQLYNVSIINNLFKINTIIGTFYLDIICFVVLGLIIYMLRKIPIFRKFL